MRTLGADSGPCARNRGVGIPTLLRQIRGDLDAIVLKALEKDRSRRYGTPSELATDIGRFLRNEPVLAQPPGAAYRTRKYIRRHRAGVAIAAGTALLAISFGAVQTIQLRRITRERDRANRMTEFITEMFRVSDPSHARGNVITASEILDRASRQIETGLANDPLVQARLMDVMGNVYRSLGLYPRAQSLLERSVGIRTRVLGARDLTTLDAVNNLVKVLYDESRFADAEKLNRRVFEAYGQEFGPRHRLTLHALNNVANALQAQGRLADAEKLQREALEIERGAWGAEDPETLETLNNLANTVFIEQRNAESERLNREGLEIRRRVLGPEHPDTLNMMSNLGNVLTNEGHYAEAEQVFREALAGQRHVLGPQHPKTLLSMNNLAVPLLYERKYPEAENLLREALDAQIRGLGPAHHETAMSRYNLGCLAAVLERRDEAIALLRDAVDHGLTPYEDLGLEKDDMLASLRGEAGFTALIAHARQRAKTISLLPEP